MNFKWLLKHIFGVNEKDFGINQSTQHGRQSMNEQSLHCSSAFLTNSFFAQSSKLRYKGFVTAKENILLYIKILCNKISFYMLYKNTVNGLLHKSTYISKSTIRSCCLLLFLMNNYSGPWFSGRK